jgi:glycyl-tRNA synthetase
MFGTKWALLLIQQWIYICVQKRLKVFCENFLNVQKSGRMKVPFGIAQTGKAFRNEIVARQFIFRMRSLNKWKCNFVRPGEEMKH